MTRLYSMVVGLGFAAVPLAGCANVPLGVPDATFDGGNISDGNRSGVDASADVPACSTGEAPLPGPQLGTHVCVVVGSSRVTNTAVWPDVSTARAPIVYVQGSAATGGDGSMARPFQHVQEALDALVTLGNGTIVLDRNQHVITGTLRIQQSVAILGVAGDQGSVILPMFTATGTDPVGIDVAAGIDLHLTGVQLNKATPFGGQMIALASGATLTLRDVDIERTKQGIRAQDGAHIDALGLTIGESTDPAIELGAAGDALLRSVWLHGGRAGIKSVGAAVSVSQGLIEGVDVAGLSVNAGDVMTTAHIDRLAVVASSGSGLRLAGTSLTTTASHIMIAGTRTIVSSPGTGVGILVTGGSSFALDTDIIDDAHQGLGSEIVGNEATGIVVASAGSATIHGAYVVANGQSGMVIQDTARVDQVGYSYFSGNSGTGLMVSSGGSIAGLVCDGFVANTQGVMNFVEHTVLMEDGVMLEPGGAGFTVIVAGNLFQDSPGAGFRAIGVMAVFSNNSFVNNGMDQNVTQDTAAAADQAPGTVAIVGAP